MSVDLHLFSLPGEGDIANILEACNPYLKTQKEPAVAFIQWASVNYDWLEYTRKAFDSLAEVVPLSDDPAALSENKLAIERCGIVYISGGNTYLLNHRLHESGLFEFLRGRALVGLPIVGFSAGAMLCGPNIQTTHDINIVPTQHFDSLNLLPYNIAAHYPSTDEARKDEDDWLSEYHALHTNPILALEDNAYVRWDGEALKWVSGGAWILEAGKARVRLE
jgi:dipeptidase E